VSYVANKNGNAPSLALKASDLKPRYVNPAISPFRNADSTMVLSEISRDRSNHNMNHNKSQQSQHNPKKHNENHNVFFLL